MSGKFVLPFFASNLGANSILIGTISSISAITGMILKPIIGVIGDAGNKIKLLLFACIIFAFTPFLYLFISEPFHLISIRLFHGLATAIFGPITLAVIASIYINNRATYLGWFGTARSMGYVLGPVIGGGLLIFFKSEYIFLITGIISLISFIPMLFLLLDKSKIENSQQQSFEKFKINLFQNLSTDIHKLILTPQLWIVIIIEWCFYSVFYAMKIFIPLYLVNSGYNTFFAGSFITVIELIHILLRPAGGIVGDKSGYYPSIIFGLLILGLSMFFVSLSFDKTILIIPAFLIGISQALVLPSSMALAANTVNKDRISTTMGLIGSFRNGGKIFGPVLIGYLINVYNYQSTFTIIGLLTVSIMIVISIYFVFKSLKK
jgi:MFS family permease|tara:strand:+ start:124 stop:1254 length:1131 start_codon:yes stop_codon:yes gene_type:complete